MTQGISINFQNKLFTTSDCKFFNSGMAPNFDLKFVFLNDKLQNFIDQDNIEHECKMGDIWL